jgi:hypothetical protein
MPRILAILLLLVAAPAFAQQIHSQHGGQAAARAPIEQGQSAFAALAEIVALLRSDPATDWSRTNIPALREHLVDMDLVTTDSTVETTATDTGAIFYIAGKGRTRAAIQAMALAHAPFLQAETGWNVEASQTESGARWQVTGNRDVILALGFHGLMTIGAHHQEHHLAIATGQSPHP